MNHGEALETCIGDLCERLFFPDFTVRSPRYSKSRGREKEAADILVPCGNRLLIFQLKTKQESKPASGKSRIDFDRIRRKVEEAISQITEAISAVSNQRFDRLVTSRGLEIPFDPRASWEMIGLVVVDLVGEEQHAEDERTAIYNGYTTDPGIPTHVFLRATFESIATELDTLPDLLEFLSIRGKLLGDGILAPTTDDLDLLALYKMNPRLIAQAAMGECDTLLIAAGSWSSYQTRHAEEIEQRNAANRASLIVDGAISWLHKSIGHRIEAGAPDDLNLEQGTVEAYLGAARAFASLTRLERRNVGETLEHVMERAEDRGDAFSVWRRADADWAVLCLSTQRSREERYRAIFNLSALAFCHLNLRRLLGIATEPSSESSRSFDFALLEGEPFEPSEHQQLAEEAREVFGPEQRSRTSEFNS